MIPANFQDPRELCYTISHMANVKLPRIVIVGRPNVGKSSLFNRIVGSKKAIVESSSGTTRDRLYADIRWKGKNFTLVDTGGFEAARQDDIATLVLKQLKVAIEELTCEARSMNRASNPCIRAFHER